MKKTVSNLTVNDIVVANNNEPNKIVREVQYTGKSKYSVYFYGIKNPTTYDQNTVVEVVE